MVDPFVLYCQTISYILSQILVRKTFVNANRIKLQLSFFIIREKQVLENPTLTLYSVLLKIPSRSQSLNDSQNIGNDFGHDHVLIKFVNFKLSHYCNFLDREY